VRYLSSFLDFAVDDGKSLVSDAWSVDSKFSVSRRPGEYPGQSYVVKKFEEYLVSEISVL
jgi:hypothetical protein